MSVSWVQYALFTGKYNVMHPWLVTDRWWLSRWTFDSRILTHLNNLNIFTIFFSLPFVCSCFVVFGSWKCHRKQNIGLFIWPELGSECGQHICTHGHTYYWIEIGKFCIETIVCPDVSGREKERRKIEQKAFCFEMWK